MIAPESCPNCRKRGTTCMLYHPGLKDVGRALGTHCGECRDRNVKCDMPPNVFAKILQHAEDAPDQPEEDGQDDEDGTLPEGGGTHANDAHPSQRMQDGEIPDSDDPDLKLERGERHGTDADEFGGDFDGDYAFN